MKIGLFCGCFDPIHKGHIKAALTMKEAAGLDIMYLVPANGKYSKYGAAITAGEHRLQMCRLAVCGHERLEVCAFEAESTEQPYTIDTVKHFAAVYPEARIYLCMGEDAARWVPNWICFRELRECAGFVVINRAGVTRDDLLERSGAELIRVEMKPDGVSSTEIRRALARGMSNIPGLDTKILRYITDNGLYKAASYNMSVAFDGQFKL